MDTYKIIEVKESVFADNDREAARLRQELKQSGTFLLASWRRTSTRTWMPEG